MSIVETWPWILAGTDVVLAAGASGHAILHKRDVRAAIGWVGIIWLAPIVGAFLYVWLGVNRIRRRAQQMRTENSASQLCDVHACSGDQVREKLVGVEHLQTLHSLVGQVTSTPLLCGNRVRPLKTGEEAYSRMLAEIRGASETIELSSYIFDFDVAGKQFVTALAEARERGVVVRVLIDDIGSRYSWTRTPGRLEKLGVSVARFMPSIVPSRFRYSNLRSHRKILVVDGSVGFTGGMNIREGCIQTESSGVTIQDIHFELEGPIVSQLRGVFAMDWTFSTGEEIPPSETPCPSVSDGAEVFCRGIPGGPDEDLDKIRWTLLGALGAARSSVQVVTPYFLPDAPLIKAFGVAALRGVEVDVVLPARGNLRLVQWASTALLWQILETGCRVWLTPPPFDHSKLLIVDRAWTLVGSSNWDARSLRLNFEFDVECYDQTLAEDLSELIAGKIAASRSMTLLDVDGRSLPVRLRDGVARLFSPYL